MMQPDGFNGIQYKKIAFYDAIQLNRKKKKDDRNWYFFIIAPSCNLQTMDITVNSCSKSSYQELTSSINIGHAPSES